MQYSDSNPKHIGKWLLHVVSFVLPRFNLTPACKTLLLNIMIPHGRTSSVPLDSRLR